MKKWHITITENETGNTTLDIDTNAIIAAIDENEGTRALCMTRCDPITLAAALHSAQGIIEKQKALNPLVAMLMTIGSAAEESEEAIEEKSEEATNE